MKPIRYAVVLLATIVWCSQAGSQDPTPDPVPTTPRAVITDVHGNTPPEEVSRADNIRLSALQSTCGDLESVIWEITPQHRAERMWTAYDQQGHPFIVIPTGLEACTIEVRLIVALESRPATTTVTIHVAGPQPPPDPDPVPPDPEPEPEPDPPAPEPDLPDGEFGLALKMWRAAMQVQGSSRSAEAKIIRDAAFRAAVQPGGQEMVDTFTEILATDLTAEQKGRWEVWRVVYLAELKVLQDAGALGDGDPELWRQAFIEIAIGLGAVGGG